jgi:hypothetical protein
VNHANRLARPGVNQPKKLNPNRTMMLSFLMGRRRRRNPHRSLGLPRRLDQLVNRASRRAWPGVNQLKKLNLKRPMEQQFLTGRR